MADIWAILARWGKSSAIVLLSGTVGAVGGGYVSYRYAVEQTRAERFETTMLANFQEMADTKKGLYVIIDKLTADISQGKQVDSSLVEEMNLGLLDLHQRVDLFNIGLTTEERTKISDVKSALVAIKVEFSNAKSIEDLPYIATRVAQFETSFKAVEPIIEKQIGMPDQLLSS